MAGGAFTRHSGHMPATALPRPDLDTPLILRNPPRVVSDVLVAHEQPAMRLGLCEMLGRHEDTPAIPVAGEAELWRAVRGRMPGAIILSAGMGPGLVLCRRIATAAPQVAVVMCVRMDTPVARLAAAIAGARGVVAEGAGDQDLVRALRRALDGPRGGPLAPPDPLVLRALQARVAPEDRAIVALLLDGTSTADVAAVLGVAPARAQARIDALLAALS